MKIKYWLLALIMVTSMINLGCGSSNDNKATLNIYSWADYYDPEVISQFEKENYCQVNYDVFSNNEEMLAKLQAGGAQYDLIQPSDYMVNTLLKLNLIEKLELKNIPNMKNISTALQHPAYDPTGEYAPVFTTGITGIIYNKKYIATPPTSWNDLWNPAYEGKVILLNDSREVFSVGLKKLGYSNNETDTAHLEEAYLGLEELNKNILAYDTENIKQKFIAEEAWIGMMWSGDAAYSQNENPDLGFIIPEEGTLIWADTLAIPKGAANKALAEKFINYILDADISAKNFSYNALPNPNIAGFNKMDVSYRNNPTLQMAQAQLHMGEWLQDIGSTITIYDQYWTRLKTGK